MKNLHLPVLVSWLALLLLSACTLVQPMPTTDSPLSAIPFDLGEETLVQTGAMNETLRAMPVRLTGLIAAPATGDHLPIAVIIHGSHGSGCPSTDGMTERWPCPAQEASHYAGFAYLVEALAAQGYVAVSINANPAFVMAYGEARANMRLPILFDLYLNKLAAAMGEEENLGIDLAGRIDWQQLVVLGHSASGEAVNWLVDSRITRTQPEQIAAGQGPIAAAILLAPSNTATGAMAIPVPFAVILPACDRDVAGLDGQIYYEAARQQTDRATLAASVYLVGANHNRFNPALPDETLGRASSVCNEALLPAADQQRFLADYATHFFDAVLGRGDGDLAAVGLDPAQPPPTILFGRQVLTALALPTSQRLILPLAEAGATGTATALFCAQGYLADPTQRALCRQDVLPQPGHPAQLLLAWTGNAGAYTLAVPAGQQDWSAYQTLHLRAAVDPTDERNAVGAPQAFSIQLTDGSGHTAIIALTAEAALAFPAGRQQVLGTTTGWDNKVVLSSIRTPLAAFAGIDWRAVQTLAFRFDRTPSGAIFVTDLELLKTPMTDMITAPAAITKPDYVIALEQAYGAPSQAAFGSAVFYAPGEAATDLEQAALAHYRYFVGDLWERYGEAAWLGPWRQLYRRPPGAAHAIVSELRALPDHTAALSAGVLLDEAENAAQARAALVTAFDEPAVTELAVYQLGDGGAMNGLLVAGRRQAPPETIFLIFLID